MNATELDQLEELVGRLCAEYDEANGIEFVRRAAELSVQLPERLVGFLEGFRRESLTAAVVVSGFTVSDEAIGTTPPHWRERSRATLREDAYLTLLTSRLGDLFCWKSLQDARLLNDVVPIAGDESSQTGHGSRVEFDVHCEDGFNDFRCDFLGLMCFRNQERIPTTVSLMDDIRLGAADEKVLRQERFVLSPDSENVRNASSLGQTGPRLVSLLNGDADSPYVRVDCREYMKAVDGDDEANLAMTNLLGEFRRVQQAIDLDQGDVCLIDNFRCVHGRQPFQPKYDGFDRWYRKALVTRDLRKSRTLRSSAAGYIIDMTRYA
ncbi:TauD/TfdA family dioxygenase [Streptomyces sp. ISL-86]|uniref:TauD/TfdA family dioxygenase n=1 Tax=Streptomyces sp. ISL-86 TaxID=2819187 RepID=UPI001BE71725|nr:TauD/TfdA family dioxygenase [Streptomyces sp. ISL-86]MBT2458175.1 TauD/TfdA family dioxygenase [Streptomyces sp. ISL-86]